MPKFIVKCRIFIIFEVFQPFRINFLDQISFQIKFYYFFQILRKNINIRKWRQNDLAEPHFLKNVNFLVLRLQISILSLNLLKIIILTINFRHLNFDHFGVSQYIKTLIRLLPTPIFSTVYMLNHFFIKKGAKASQELLLLFITKFIYQNKTNNWQIYLCFFLVFFWLYLWFV